MKNLLRLSGIVLFSAAVGSVGCSNGNGGQDSGNVIEAGGTVDVQGQDAAADVTTTDTNHPDASPTPDATADSTPGSDATPGTDGSTTPDASGADAGSYVDGCFVGTPVLMTDFLNRCTSAATATHTVNAPLLLPDGGVPALM